MESDEIVVLLRGITILRHLHRVEPELGFQVRGLVLGIADGLAKLRPQLRILDRDRLVDRRVAGDVGRIVRQGAQREGVLVGILALAQQFTNKVAAADVVHQVAEFPAAERVVAEVLDDGAAIGVGMRFLDLVFRESGISLQQERADLRPSTAGRRFLRGSEPSMRTSPR